MSMGRTSKKSAISSRDDPKGNPRSLTAGKGWTQPAGSGSRVGTTFCLRALVHDFCRGGKTTRQGNPNAQTPQYIRTALEDSTGDADVSVGLGGQFSMHTVQMG